MNGSILSNTVISVLKSKTLPLIGELIGNTSFKFLMIFPLGNCHVYICHTVIHLEILLGLFRSNISYMYKAIGQKESAMDLKSHNIK